MRRAPLQAALAGLAVEVSDELLGLDDPMPVLRGHRLHPTLVRVPEDQPKRDRKAPVRQRCRQTR